jgi:Holliday junction resolvase RusA-like endonuclease
VSEIVITVVGAPAPQGSKRAFAVRGKGGVPTGRVAVIESSHDRVKSWRQAVIDEARGVMARHAEVFGPRLPLEGALEAEMTFFFRRPKSHYRTGRNAHQLREDAPQAHIKPPDVSKLCRATEDALTDVCLWLDDAQVVRYARLDKYWCDGLDVAPGAVIRIREVMS